LFDKDNEGLGGTTVLVAFSLLDMSLANPDLFLLRVMDPLGLLAFHFALAYEAGDFRIGGRILFLQGFLLLGRFIKHRKPPRGVSAIWVPTSGGFTCGFIPSNFIRIYPLGGIWL
jgi:hypothetical protein